MARQENRSHPLQWPWNQGCLQTVQEKFLIEADLKLDLKSGLDLRVALKSRFFFKMY